MYLLEVNDSLPLQRKPPLFFVAKPIYPKAEIRAKQRDPKQLKKPTYQIPVNLKTITRM